MSNFLDKFKAVGTGLFSSQDSKYFIKTAFKITLVPLLSFSIIFYSLWNILEMNYSFFVANGFAEGADFKEAFVDKVLININEYFIYFGIIIAGVFMGGLLVAHLALRPFEEIQAFSESLQEDPDLEFEVNKINSKKIIYQGAMAFFDYLKYASMGERVNGDDLIPEKLKKLKSPPTDKIFVMQYIAIVTIIALVTNIVFYMFTTELYQEIVSAGVDLLKGNKVISKFMTLQEGVLFNIYASAMALNVILYLGLSKNIIKAVDGVSYAFCRDFMQILKGDHKKRIFPRFTDPGKEAANACNQYLDMVFAEYDQESMQEDVVDYEDSEELEVASEVELIDEPIAPPQRLVLHKTPVTEQPCPVAEVQNPLEEQEELPPSFIEQKQVAGSDVQVFNITTPKGYKVENLSEGQILKLLTELEKKSS
jgi:hypothetical protein